MLGQLFPEVSLGFSQIPIQDFCSGPHDDVLVTEDVIVEHL